MVNVDAIVKSLAVLSFLFFAVASAVAQTQERKLMERINKPDLQLGSPFQKKSFNDGSSLHLRSSPAAERKYLGSKSMSGKEFPLTRSFLGFKNPWVGKQVYDTKNSSVWSKSIAADADKQVPIRKAETVASSDANKAVNYGSPVVPQRPFVPAPASPGAVSQITDKINNKMTIDEIRDLLN